MLGCELSKFVVLNASISCGYRFGFALLNRKMLLLVWALTGAIDVLTTNLLRSNIHFLESVSTSFPRGNHG